MPRQPTPDILEDGASSAVDVVTLVMGEPVTAKNAVRRDGIQDVPVAQIDDNPFQPRVEYSGIEELAADIGSNGLLQVPKGRRMPDGRVQLQYGHRRLRAVIALGWKTMPVEVQSLIVDHDMAVRAWSENHNRQDFTAIDQARYFRKLVDSGWTQKLIADRLNLSASTISNTLRLLELPEDLATAIAEKQLSARQGEALVSLMTLPETIRTRGEAQYRDEIRPSAIIRAAIHGGASSDEIRNRTAELIKHSAPAVHLENWYGIEMSDDAGVIVSPTCKACPQTIKRDSGVYCTGSQECRNARANKWALQKLQAAADETGIPAYGMMPPYDAYENMDSYDTRKLFAELQTNGGCPHGNLRLAYQSDRWSKGPFDGHPNAFPICLHGKGRKCRCLVARQREAAKSETDGKTTESRRKALLAAAMPVLADALSALPEGLLRYVIVPALGKCYGSSEDRCHTQPLDEMLREVVEKFFNDRINDYQSVALNRERLETVLTGAGLFNPWTLAGQTTTPADAADTIFPVL